MCSPSPLVKVWGRKEVRQRDDEPPHEVLPDAAGAGAPDALGRPHAGLPGVAKPAAVGPAGLHAGLATHARGLGVAGGRATGSHRGSRPRRPRLAK